MTSATVAAHGDGDSAEELDALGDGVHHIDLLFKVLIEEEVELVEGGAAYLPVVFFIHVAGWRWSRRAVG